MILIQFVFLAEEILFISQNGKLGPAKHPHLDFSINIKAIYFVYMLYVIIYKKNMYLVTASMFFFYILALFLVHLLSWMRSTV